MRSALSIAIAGLLVSLSGAASADTFHATRSNQLVERSHTIHLTWHRGYADLVVTRTAFNGGERHDQATYFIDLPDGAVATRLRTMAEVNGEPRWYEGQLLEAELAAARYRELTGIGGYYPKDPALLSWRSQDRLALQVFPCPPSENKTVEYTLRIPTIYEEGRERLQLPVMGTEAVVPELFVVAADRRDTITVDGKPVAGDQRIELSDALELDMAYGEAARLEGSMATVNVSTERSLSHLRIDAADALSEVPDGAWIVVAVDASKTYGPGRVEASGAALASYLSHFAERSARVRIATFDRAVHPVGDDFDDVPSAISKLEALPTTVANGSHVDAAFSFAEAELRKAPPDAPKRIVVTTDFMTRAAVTPARLEAVSRRLGATVHLATVTPGRAFLRRDDDSAWARVARSTGGVLWRAYAEASATGRQRDAFEEWARPLRIDNLNLRATGTPLGLVLPESLDEGQSIEHLAFGDGPTHAALLEGELWSKPVHKALFATPSQKRLWAGLVFGTELLWSLTEDEQMPLAMLGGVVSPVTSYLAIEPGVRPSTEGLEEGEGGLGQGIGLGSIGTIGHGAGAGGAGFSFDHLEWLRNELSAQRRRCGITSKTRLVLETTAREVVDVVVDAPDESPDGRACFAEAGWALDLPEDFRRSHETYELSF